MKTVYVDDTNQATIICPKCGFEKNIDVTNFKNTQKKLKAKCRCGEVFRLTLEFRKHYRKKVRLHGEYFVQGRDEKGEIIIEDISASGIRFASLKPHYISRSDTVELKFTLDNPMRTEIHKLIKIIWIIDCNVGAQYIDPKSLEKDLDFYLRT
ncbi:MAG: PilZ domain-containing protein [Thermodesulfobacteriota bacterium]|nr:PilZ domain-containing protein [Thermodesulfobacteriota bacterium]